MMNMTDYRLPDNDPVYEETSFPMAGQDDAQPHIYDDPYYKSPRLHREGSHLTPISMKIATSLAVFLAIATVGLSVATFVYVHQFRANLVDVDTLTRQELLQLEDILSEIRSTRKMLKESKQAAFDCGTSRTLEDSKNDFTRLKNFFESETGTLKSELSRLGSVLRNNYIRLSGNGTNYGRVEIKYQGEWGTICDDSWDIKDARVVCRMLGYNNATSAPGHAHYGKGSGEILFDDVACKGDEPTIWQCASSPWGTNNCGHSEDASVVCI